VRKCQKMRCAVMLERSHIGHMALIRNEAMPLRRIVLSLRLFLSS